MFVVWGKLEGKICGFVFEKGMQGKKTTKIEDKFSLRVSITGEIIMDNVLCQTKTCSLKLKD